MQTNKEKLEQSKANMREIFKKNPELKGAFKETLGEMKKPENIDKMVRNTYKVMGRLKALKTFTKDQRSGEK